MKLTKKQIFIGGLLRNNEKGLSAYEVINCFREDLKKQGIDVEKINSVNATLASLATKELVEKTKKVYKDKMVTNYTLTEKGKELFEKPTKEEE